MKICKIPFICGEMAPVPKIGDVIEVIIKSSFIMPGRYNLERCNCLNYNGPDWHLGCGPHITINKFVYIPYGSDGWHCSGFIIERAEEKDKIVNLNFCSCEKPNLVENFIYGEKFFYCRSCKKERK